MKQHADLSKFNAIRLVLMLVSVVFINACATAPEPSITRAEIETRDVSTSETQAPIYTDDQATAYNEQQYHRQQAELYAQQSIGNENDADGILSAAEHYIQSSDHIQAQQQISQIDIKTLNKEQLGRLSVIKAYISYNSDDYTAAIQTLAPILQSEAQHTTDTRITATKTQNTHTAQRQVDAHLLSALSYQQLGNNELAIYHLAQREKLLNGVARGENARYLMTLVQNLDESERASIADTTTFPDVRNRIIQSLTGQAGQHVSQAPEQFQQWADASPASDKVSVANQWDSTSPEKIALLLPLTSRYKKAAMALRDGLIYQHEQNTSQHQPIIETYDIGDNTQLITQYYQAAINNGADFIIGPLGKAYANHLTPYMASTTTPSLLLGGDYAVDNIKVARLTFSPEIEGINVAEMAFNRGFVNAALVMPSTEKGKRTQQAFTAHWLSRGGRISRVIQYSAQQFDYRTELKQLFDINQSEYRHQQLSKTLGFKPKFNAYQRNDYDFIFMLANNATGRILKPQINFFNSRNTPILASESIYNGIVDKVNNTDLNDVQFPVIPWAIESEQNSPFAGQLNRLFAMGMDAYSVTGQFQRLRYTPQSQINGKLGILKIERNGIVHYKPVEASFADGLVKSNAIAHNDGLRNISNSQLLIDQRNHSMNQGSEYNDNNWDARQNSRKTGP